jgi:hypothetical protein
MQLQLHTPFTGAANSLLQEPWGSADNCSMSSGSMTKPSRVAVLGGGRAIFVWTSRAVTASLALKHSLRHISPYRVYASYQDPTSSPSIPINTSFPVPGPHCCASLSPSSPNPAPSRSIGLRTPPLHHCLLCCACACSPRNTLPTRHPSLAL